MCGRFVANLPNNLDDNVVERLLGVYIGYSDLTVLEVQLLYAVIDGLQVKSVITLPWANRKAYPLADGDVNFLRFDPRNELRPFVVVQLKTCELQRISHFRSHGVLHRAFPGSC